MKFKLILSYLFFTSFLFSANSLKLVLNSGEILIGESKSLITEDYYLIKSDILGEMSIPKDKVQSFTILKKIETEAPEQLELAKASQNQLSDQSTEIKEVEASKTQLITELYDKVKLIDAPKSWNGNLKLGMNLSFGDREYTHTYLRGNVKVQQEGSPHLFQLSGEYNFRETEQGDGTQNISEDRHHVNFIYRWFFSERWFFQNATSYRTDKLKGIDNELQNIVGYGYRTTFFDDLELLIGSGVGFQDRSIVGLAEESPVILNVFQELNWKPTKRVEFKQTLNFFQNPQEMDIYNYKITLGVNYRFTDLLGVEMRYFMDFDNGITENIKKDTRFENALIFYF